MRFTSTRRGFARSFVALLSIALLSCSLAACGGGSSHHAVSDGQDAATGRLTVVNQSAFVISTLQLNAQNGTATALNLSHAESAIFSTVGQGPFTVVAYGSSGNVLLNTGGNMPEAGNLTLTLR